MGFLKGLINVMAPEIEDTETALQEGLASLTWANRDHRNPATPQPRPASPEQTEAPPSVPERNPDRPGYTLRIQQIQQAHQLGLERQNQENPALSHQESPEIPQHPLEHRRRATSPTDAEVSHFLRATRHGHQRRETSPDPCRGNPTIQEVASRKDFQAIHRGLYHPQPRRGIPTMAGTRRTDYLDVSAASTPLFTPHQIFLKGQVKRQQDATDEWARRTGKSAPPYRFEDFIGKGAYGRVFRA